MLLEALPYHLKVCDHFKQQTKTWDFFAAARTKEDQLMQFQTELLKHTYQFNPANDAFIYDKIKVAKERLGLGQLPVTAYQAQYTDEVNATIVYFHNEAHIVFSGNITQKLDDRELLAVIAHELTHIKLYSLLDGELETADRIIMAIANNYSSEAPYQETARLFRLYAEIFCDRGAFMVLESEEPVINMLVKIATGLDKVNAESYLRQADEVLSGSAVIKSGAGSHPENFIRAKALQLWRDKGSASEASITALIEGHTDLDQLDIFSQKELASLTRDLLLLYLQPGWYQSTIVAGLAKQYFSDFSWNQASIPQETLANKISGAHTSLKDYFSYVLLDFALADPALEESPPGRAFQFAEEIQLKEAYEAVVKKELQLSDKKLQQYKQKALAAIMK